MSLMLRKQCEDTLDSFGLGHLHATVDRYNKLSIVTECGKPFMTIQGIQFSRQIPTIAEIEYATELLDTFMGIHSPDILEYISSKEKFKKRKEPKNRKFECNFEKQSYCSNKSDHSICKYEDSIFTVILNTQEKKEEIYLKDILSNFTELEKVKKADYSRPLLVEAKKLLKIFHEYHVEATRIDALKEKLSVCNV